MSGGYKNGHGGTPDFFTKIRQLEQRIQTLEKRQATVVVGATANNVIVMDTNGVSWQLGVTTSGATTWTQV